MSESSLIKNKAGMTFVRIPAGSFLMGRSRWEDTEPVHKVTLDSFYMSAYETTNAEFEAFRKHKRGEFCQGDHDPVDNVSYEQAAAFADWLGKLDGRRYALPTEAQWEYAARGGLEGKDFPWGNKNPYRPSEGPELALVDGLRCKPVGSYAPNAFGLYDMCGNVGELVREVQYNYSSVVKQLRNPLGPTTGRHNLRIFRGHGVASAGMNTEIWMRWLTIGGQDGVGFRLVILSGKPKR